MCLFAAPRGRARTAAGQCPPCNGRHEPVVVAFVLFSLLHRVSAAGGLRDLGPLLAPTAMHSGEGARCRWVSVEIKSNRGTQRTTQHSAYYGDCMRRAQGLADRPCEYSADTTANRYPSHFFRISHGRPFPRTFDDPYSSSSTQEAQLNRRAYYVSLC
jgi:hypothetical protein